jgi:ketosteroid isomerase-like protein
MANNIDIVKRMNKAAEAKDFETVKTLLHPKYTLKDPMMKMNGAEEFLAAMKACPFTCHFENTSFVAEGDKVVQTLDVVMTAPVAYRQRMCSISMIEDGKIRSEEMFYDTAQIPKEAIELIQKSMKEKQKAA